jgi:hypothetical protein
MKGKCTLLIEMEMLLLDFDVLKVLYLQQMNSVVY